jgi:pre-mRNA-processing factor SLU7
MRELPDGTKVADDPKLNNGKQEFQRPSGDAAEFERLQKFAWQSERAGGDVHLQANPTEGEIRHKKLLEQTEKKRSALRSSVLDKYGGEEHLAPPPKELLKSTEQFVQYTKFGEVIKGSEEPQTKSRYPEDGILVLSILLIVVYINNHTSVFGSWFRDGRWGYSCCHQFHKNSYCTGAVGVAADEATARLARGEIEDTESVPSPPKDSVAVADAGQVRDKIRDQAKRKRHAEVAIDGRAMTASERSIIEEEEYEDYRRKLAKSDDPLLAMQSLKGGV